MNRSCVLQCATVASVVNEVHARRPASRGNSVNARRRPKNPSWTVGPNGQKALMAYHAVMDGVAHCNPCNLCNLCDHCNTYERFTLFVYRSGGYRLGTLGPSDTSRYSDQNFTVVQGVMTRVKRTVQYPCTVRYNTTVQYFQFHIFYS